MTIYPGYFETADPTIELFKAPVVRGAPLRTVSKLVNGNALQVANRDSVVLLKVHEGYLISGIHLSCITPNPPSFYLSILAYDDRDQYYDLGIRIGVFVHTPAVPNPDPAVAFNEVRPFTNEVFGLGGLTTFNGALAAIHSGFVLANGSGCVHITDAAMNVNSDDTHASPVNFFPPVTTIGMMCKQVLGKVVDAAGAIAPAGNLTVGTGTLIQVGPDGVAANYRRWVNWPNLAIAATCVADVNANAWNNMNSYIGFDIIEPNLNLSKANSNIQPSVGFWR